MCYKNDIAGYMIEVNNLESFVSQQDAEILFLSKGLEELLVKYIEAVDWDASEDEIATKIHRILDKKYNSFMFWMKDTMR